MSNSRRVASLRREDSAVRGGGRGGKRVGAWILMNCWGGLQTGGFQSSLGFRGLDKFWEPTSVGRRWKLNENSAFKRIC